MRPFFSIIIPIYNKRPHICRSVGSALNQSFSNIELLAINDASTDGSLEELEKFTDGRIRILHRSTPGPGGYAARNLGIENARGEWIAFLDADDEWYPYHLERMYHLNTQFPDTNFMGCGWEIRDKLIRNLDSYYKKNYHRGNHELDTKTYLFSYLHGLPPINTSVACVKRSSLKSQNLFPIDVKAQRGGDSYAWFKMICHHRQMAWSAHLGAIYYQDSVNMVTKYAPSTPYLMRKEIYNELSLNLNSVEKILLKKNLNKKLKYAWVRNIRRGKKNFTLFTKLYWKGDIPNVLKLTLISILPSSLINHYLSKRNPKKSKPVDDLY